MQAQFAKIVESTTEWKQGLKTDNRQLIIATTQHTGTLFLLKLRKRGQRCSYNLLIHSAHTSIQIILLKYNKTVFCWRRCRNVAKLFTQAGLRLLKGQQPGSSSLSWWLVSGLPLCSLCWRAADSCAWRRRHSNMSISNSCYKHSAAGSR